MVIKMSQNYSNISLPTELIDEIDSFIKRNQYLGYKSRAEFIKEAIRLRIGESQSPNKDKPLTVKV